jgi:lysozyme family protein
MKMAKFDEAYAITLNFEGSYGNDSDDVGGETYKGISRNHHPNWKGWMVVDGHKNSVTFEQDLQNDEDLQRLIKEFYKANFWDINLLDRISSQNIANEMFDTGVNMGVSRAAMFLQIALNYLNKNEKLYEDLVVDGKIGNKTFSAVNIILNNGEENLLYKVLNILQGYHYLEYMSKSPTQEKFARGWFSRVEFLK